MCRDLREETLPSDDEEFIESVWTDRAEITRMVAAGEIENITLLAALQLYDSFNNSAL